MKILAIFIASFNPVLKVLLLTALGLFLALDRVDILGAEARNHLNNVSFYVFSPALIGSNLASNMTVKSIGMSWFMPLNILFTFIIGSALGWVLSKITRAPRDLWGLIIGCCAAGNLGNMLLIIIPAICKERGSPFGNAQVCYNQGMAYISLAIAIGTIYTWSYVYNIVRIYASQNSEITKADDANRINHVGDQRAENLPNSSTGPVLLPGCSPKKDGLDQFEIECPLSEGKPEVPLSGKLKHCLKTFATKLNMRKILAPSTIGAIVGITVGVIPQLRMVLIGDSAPLRVVQDTAFLLGEASIPTLSLIVGANLLEGLKSSRIHVSVTIGIIVIRYIILPISGIGIVKVANHFGLVNSNKLYQFNLLLQFALPPATTLGTMTQLHGAGESECSVIMLWTYALAPVALTFWSAYYMWLVG